MKREDERILEYLESEGMATADLIANEVFQSVSEGHVKERFAHLEYAGLIFRAGLESYELTEAGHRYLRGDLDADHLPTPTVDRVLRRGTI